MSKVEPITREEAVAALARIDAAAKSVGAEFAEVVAIERLTWQRILATLDAQRWVPVTERVPEKRRADCWIAVRCADGQLEVCKAAFYSATEWYAHTSEYAEREVDWGIVEYWKPYYTPTAPEVE